MTWAFLAGLDLLVQTGVLWFSPIFSGAGLIGFALLPIAFAWYLLVVVALLAAFPLAYLCLRKLPLAPLGAALLVLAVLNLMQVWSWREAQQPTQAETAARAIESSEADEVYRCMSEWFSAPRRVEEVDGNELIFAGGVRIDVCRLGDHLCGGEPASVARRQAFGRFAREHVLGRDVSVALTTRPFFGYEGGDWCRNGAPPGQTKPGFHGRYSADVSFQGKRLTVTASPPRIEDFR